MRKITIAAITLFFFTLTPIVRAEIADRIVAIVNDDIITLSEVNEEGAPYFQDLIKRAPSERLPSEMQKLRQEILSHLIDQRLIEQQAAKFEITVTDEEIDQTIESMLTENRATKEDMKKDLASKGLSEAQYRKQLKNQILQSRLIGREVRSKVVITDEKINEYYKEHYTAKAGVAGFHLLQMGFLWGDKYKQKNASEARLAAENAKKQLAAGDNFAAVARASSDLPSKEDGGDIGVFETQELAVHMKDVVLALKSGETSDIIETPNSYQIIQLVSIQDGSESSGPPMIEVRKEIETKLYQEEGEQLFKKWLSDLRGQAFIKQNL